jgi:transposase
MRLTSKHVGRPQALGQKNGAWPADRANKGRYEQQAARRDRRTWATHPVIYDGRAGQRLQWSEGIAGLPSKADWLLGDRGYDADWFREALVDKKVTPCIPGRNSRDKPVKYDKRCYRKRNRIEIMFGRLKDWRRVATRYDRSPNVFLSAIALATIVIFWL